VPDWSEQVTVVAGWGHSEPWAVDADAQPVAWTGESGLRLEPKENAVADAFLAAAVAAEPLISDRVRRVRDAVARAELVGYPDHVLKSANSFKRRLATEMSVSGKDVHTALPAMKDSVRYMMQLPFEDYVAGTRRLLAGLVTAGFDNVWFQCRWRDDGYKGLNCCWYDPLTTHTFEVQFHTPESVAASRATHALYARHRLPDRTEDELAELRWLRDEIYRGVRIPPGAHDITLG
jgi:hypothetical protein